MDAPKLPSVHVTRLVEHDGDLYEEAITPICDFCGDVTPTWDYDCADFEHDFPGFANGSEGGWLACGPCSMFIEAGDRDGLADRAMSGFPAPRDTVAWSAARSTLMAFQSLFFRHRKGERVRWHGGSQS